MNYSTCAIPCHLLTGMLFLAISGCGATQEFKSQNRLESSALKLVSGSGHSNPRSIALNHKDKSYIVQVAYNDRTSPLSPPEPVPTEPESVQTSVVWTLSQLEAFALQNNPAIHQASASAHKSMGYRDQVGRRPNPTVGYQGTQLADAGTDQHVAFVEQDIVLGNKLAQNRNVLSQDVQVQLWEVETQRYRVLTDVRRFYYSVLAAQLKRDLAAEYQRKAKDWRTQADRRNAAGEGSKLEIGQSAILSKQFQLLERQADAELRGAWKRMMATAGLPGDSEGRLSGELSQSDFQNFEAISARILTGSPELQAARARCARAQANLTRQRAQAVPNLSITLAAGQDNGTGSEMVNSQIGLPIPVYNRNQGNIAAAHAEVRRATQNIRRLEHALHSRIAETQQQWEEALAAVQQYRDEIIPQAEETLALMEHGLRTEGNVSFVEVLLARKTAFDAQWEYLSAQTQLAQAGSLLDGMTLTGALDETRDTEMDSGLRDQTFSGQ